MPNTGELEIGLEGVAPASASPGIDAWGMLMAAAQAGDQAAYARLLMELLPMLRAIVRRQRVHPAHVEDVVQDVLMTVHRVRHTYDPHMPFMPWIGSITRRRAIDVLRREGRRNSWESTGHEDFETFAGPDAKDEIGAQESRDWLLQAVAKLPARQRKALELVKLKEMSVAEAAQASGQTEGAVKVNVHRAIKALRELLGKSAGDV